MGVVASPAPGGRSHDSAARIVTMPGRVIRYPEQSQMRLPLACGYQQTPCLVRPSKLHGVVVTVIVTNSAAVSFRRQRVGAPECAQLRMVYPGSGAPAFEFIGESLEFHLQGGEMDRECVGCRRSPP